MDNKDHVKPQADQQMANTTPIDRQEEYRQILESAMQDQNLVDALQAFEMGEQAYIQAIIGSTVVTILSSDKTNLEGADANLDSNQS